MGFLFNLINQSGLQQFKSSIKHWSSQVELPEPGHFPEGRLPFQNPHYYSDSEESDTESDSADSHQVEKSDEEASLPSSGDGIPTSLSQPDLSVVEPEKTVIGFQTFEFRGMNTFDYASKIVYSEWQNPYETGQTTIVNAAAAYSPRSHVRYNIPGYEYSSSGDEEEEEEEDEGKSCALSGNQLTL